ncbi:hypothetical protein, partial [Neobacillus cucumis]|uniref:hypothetical protein n=1 Tax=Neobacillus cucumis TaxID=1740721 RepID=UPI0035F2579B
DKHGGAVCDDPHVRICERRMNISCAYSILFRNLFFKKDISYKVCKCRLRTTKGLAELIPGLVGLSIIVGVSLCRSR